MPSPLTSTAVTEIGWLPVAKVCWVAKEAVVAPGAVVFSSTDTVFEKSFATIRSGLPSPFRSADVTEAGSLPVAKVCWAANDGVMAPGTVVFSSTDTVFPLSFATIRSGLPSPLRSAAVGEAGTLPVAKVCWAAKAGLVIASAVVFSSTDTVFDWEFATIKSSWPSPFKSADVTDAESCRWRRSAGRRRGGGGSGLSCSAAPTPCSIWEFATIRSGLPSPLKSADVTENGAVPVAKVC